MRNMKPILNPLSLFTTLVLLGSCESYNCADYANCPSEPAKPDAAVSVAPTTEVHQLQPGETSDVDSEDKTPSPAESSSATSSSGTSPKPGAVATSSEPSGDEPTTSSEVTSEEASTSAAAITSEALVTASDGSTTAGEQSTSDEVAAMDCDDDEYWSGETCTTFRSCTGAEYEYTAPTSTSDRVCAEVATCQPGTFESTAPDATTDRKCSLCVSGTFSSGVNATSCAAWSECSESEFEQTAPSSTTDRVCSPKTACGPGTFVAHDDDESDRTCQSCPIGTFSSTVNAAECTPWTTCSAGETESVAPSPSNNRVCSSCGAGKYENGGQCLTLTKCTANEYETVAPTATSNRECEAVTHCVAGEMETAEPTETSDRVCAKCSDGTFSAQQDATSCQTWTTCSAGSRVLTKGSATADRVCTFCNAGTYSSTDNADACTTCTSGYAGSARATSCTPWTICQAGSEVVDQGTSSTDRTCAACPSQTYSTGENADSCSAWKVCLSSQYESTTPSSTRNRGCTNLTNCGNDNQYESKAPTTTSNRECKACPGDSRNRGQNEPGCFQVTAGDSHACYLNTGVDDIQSGGNVTNVRCWGKSDARLTPPTGKFVSISAGYDFTCGMLTDGTVRCWGINANIANNPKPNTVFTRVSSGSDSACAIKTDKTLSCWGANNDGQAQPPSAANTYDQIDGGIANCGLRSGSKFVECWGNDFGGGYIPTEYASIAMRDVSSGGYSAVLADVKVSGVRPIYYWGIVSGNVVSATPTSTNFKDIEGSGLFMCGLIDSAGANNDEYPLCWTSDDELEGEVNNPVLKPSYRMLALAAGYGFVCGINEFGRPACWGRGPNGETSVPNDL